jgi:integrase
MPRLSSSPPRYCLHKATGRAVVYIDGKSLYLGRFGSAESKAAYRRVIAEWSGRRDSEVAPAPVGVAPSVPTIAEAIMQYKAHAETYYQSREVDNLREALRPLRELFGKVLLSGFGPSQLRLLRQRWIDRGIARNTINARMGRIRRFFRWAASYELVDAKILERLDTVEPLMPGRGGRETRPKQPMTWEAVEATLPHLSPMVQAMVLFGWHTGARPSEIVGLTTGLIDQKGDVWLARLILHKNAHRGLSREIPIGRAAQSILAPWLRPESPSEPIFSPLRADARQPKRKGRRSPGKSYGRAGFGQAIRRACRRAGIEAWGPNALRHAYATRLRDAAGIEASQMALGHARPDTTLIYTSAAKGRMLDAVRMVG